MTSAEITATIERYLFGQLNVSERLTFEARLLLNPALKKRVRQQERIYRMIRLSGRRNLKFELEQIQRRLFSDVGHSDFKAQVLRIFTKT